MSDMNVNNKCEVAGYGNNNMETSMTIAEER